jgi:hypothetical protein
MTENEWLLCEDAKIMIQYLWDREPYLSLMKKFRHYPPAEKWENYLELELPLYRFYLASCRNIWKLLPQEESRKGVELAEQFISGDETWEKLSEYNRHTEGAAFFIEYNTDSDKIAMWCKDAKSLSSTVLKTLLNSQELIENIKPRDLLLSAAYFADYAMIYPSITPKGPPRCHAEFMFADILRQYVNYPG